MLYFESETVLKFYNLEASSLDFGNIAYALIYHLNMHLQLSGGSEL